MSSPAIYRQCVLESGNRVRTSFIPERFAHCGQVVRLRESGVWSGPWVVSHAGATAAMDDLDIGKSIRQHRDRTGDSLRKELA